MEKLKVEIWSDVVCPFCYIGKRRFEQALQSFPQKEDIEIEWKSFQLSPDVKTNPDISIHEYLAQHKGIPIERAHQMNDQVTQMAAEVGLSYDFDKAVVANTVKAHRLIQLAKTKGKQGEAKERLMKAYFTLGENIDDIPTLIELGTEIGLNADEITNVYESNKFEEEVQADIYEAWSLRIQSVPFFVFNRRYGVSGAQPVEVFAQTLEKSFTEWRESQPAISMTAAEGDSCSVDGECS